VVDRIRCELLTPTVEPPAGDRLRALLDSWSSAIPLTSTISDGVIDRLEEPSRCDAVVDAISEGLANAVRHGDGTPVTLDVRSSDESGVAVVVTSGGSLASSEPGIGLRQLAERGTVELREAAGRVRLAVAIP
jgi:signal transduction histidine kinase